MFGLVEMKRIALPQKKNAKFHDAYQKNGKLFMTVGSPGGSTDYYSVLQTILNVYEYNLVCRKRLMRSRFHHQWLPDLIIRNRILLTHKP
jgi:gamma-glutamyltranspeptidase/glutathione hydrolase